MACYNLVEEESGKLCTKTRRTVFIYLVVTPLCVVLVLLLAAIINAALLESPFERVELPGEKQPRFTNASDEVKRARAENC